MTLIELTEAQMDKILNELADVRDVNDRFSIEVAVDDSLTVTAKGFVEIDGYREDDYERGTGAFVETYRRAHVELTGWCYDHVSEEDVEVVIGGDSTARIERFLNAA